MSLEAAVADITGRRVARVRPLSGGCVAEVKRVDMADGGPALVAKLGGPGSGLALEGAMLADLAPHLPVPEVLHASDSLLLMTLIETDGILDDRAQEHAAALIARLHAVRGPHFGYSRDTLIGGLDQPNPPTARWVDFFRDHRLLYMAAEAETVGRLPGRLRSRIDTLAARLEDLIPADVTPSLLHGDLWGGNLLPGGRGIAGFIDPAIYWGDAEMDLAFSTLFDTFGTAFFRRYRDLRPLAPGFFEDRRDLYNLWPLLVHVRLFGGSYVGGVERALARFGC